MIKLPTAYCAPIYQFALALQNGGYCLEVKEHFVKQSFRNRCEIYGANGRQKLVIPLQWRNHTPIEEVKLSYAENWQKLHWKSLVSAYRASPFFDFYEDDFAPLYQTQAISYLVDWNAQFENLVCELIGLELNIEKSSHYEDEEPDYRQIIHPKNKALRKEVEYPKYIQVFGDKHGFISNLSILDLLFNLGPETNHYLKNLSLTA
ncbi:MAG: WbqC family protein [Vicingaceae bacterium]